MRIAFDHVPYGVSTVEVTCGSEEIHLESDGVRFTGPIVAKLRLFKQNDEVFVNAELSVAIELECARCLSPVHRILGGTSENQYRPLPEAARYLLDDMGIRYYSGEYIELSDDFRESLLLEIPPRALCSEDCKGLCPHCGQDLNKGECNCHLESEEVRTSKFADLIKMLELK